MHLDPDVRDRLVQCIAAADDLIRETNKFSKLLADARDGELADGFQEHVQLQAVLVDEAHSLYVQARASLVENIRPEWSILPPLAFR